ncbi:MAG: RNA polymerase sigma factor [Planctomycetes bacterium]|nr:RNA polymerase sigma factor [Planctomycetota bacterium]
MSAPSGGRSPMTELSQGTVPIPPGSLTADAPDGAARLEALLAEHRAVMLRAIRRVLSDEGEVEDAYQDAVLSVYRRLGSFRSESALSTWLYRVARNAAIGRRRSASLRRRLEGPLELLELATDAASNASGTIRTSPATGGLEAEETRRLVRRAVASLPSSVRVAVEMRYFEEAEYERVASRLGVSVNAAVIRVHRGLRLLHDQVRRRSWIDASGMALRT